MEARRGRDLYLFCFVYSTEREEGGESGFFIFISFMVWVGRESSSSSRRKDGIIQGAKRKGDFGNLAARFIWGGVDGDGEFLSFGPMDVARTLKVLFRARKIVEKRGTSRFRQAQGTPPGVLQLVGVVKVKNGSLKWLCHSRVMPM